MKRLTTLCLLLVTLPGVALSQTEIRRYVLGCGAMGANGDPHLIRSVLGQDAVGVITAEVHEIRSGFWPGFGIDVPSDVPEYVDAVPGRFQLYQNRPNPFHSQTAITYDVPASGGALRLAVYGVDGRHVRTLVHGTQSPGQKTVWWDGRDESGQVVAAGIYFYVFDAPGYSRKFKTIVLR